MRLFGFLIFMFCSPHTHAACRDSLERRLPGSFRTDVLVEADRQVDVYEDGRSIGYDYGVIATITRRTKHGPAAGETVVLIFTDRPNLLAATSRRIPTLYKGIRLIPADNSLAYGGQAVLHYPAYIVIADRSKTTPPQELRETIDTSESPHFGAGTEIDRGPRRTRDTSGPDDSRDEHHRAEENYDPTIGPPTPHFGGH